MHRVCLSPTPEEPNVSKNVTRAIIGILLVALARRVTDLIVERVFGPDQQQAKS